MLENQKPPQQVWYRLFKGSLQARYLASMYSLQSMVSEGLTHAVRGNDTPILDQQIRATDDGIVTHAKLHS